MGNRKSGLNQLIISLLLAELLGSAKQGSPLAGCNYDPQSVEAKFAGGVKKTPQGIPVYDTFEEAMEAMFGAHVTPQQEGDLSYLTEGDRSVKRLRQEAKRLKKAAQKYAIDLGEVLAEQVKSSILEVEAARDAAIATINAAKAGTSAGVSAAPIKVEETVGSDSLLSNSATATAAVAVELKEALASSDPNAIPEASTVTG